MLEKGKSISESKVDASLLYELNGDFQSSPVSRFEVESTSVEELTFEMWGVDSDAFVSVWRPSISGEFPVKPNEVLVGWSLSQIYGVKTGNIINIKTSQLEASLLVTGIVRTSSFYDTGLVTSHENLRDLSNQQSYSFIEIKTRDSESFLNQGEKFDEWNVMVLSSLAMQDYLNSFASEIYQDLILVSILVSLIAFIGVSHTMYKIITDSQVELNILRSIGLTRTKTLSLVILDCLLLCAAGSILGLILGIILSSSASVLIYLSLKTVFLRPIYDPWIAVYCVSLSVLLGFAGGGLSILLKRPFREVYGVQDLL
jgi:ABC-type lipoprotein release transport system permease subunit